MKVTIVGASGFVGRNLAAQLVREGSEVTAIVRPGKEKIFFEMGAKVRNISDISANSTEVVENLTDLFAGQDAVVHMALMWDADVKVYEFVNNVVNQNVINAAMRAGVKKIVTNSGLGAASYGKKKETTNGYFRVKKILEANLLKAWRTAGLRFVVFRPSYIIGKGDELTQGLVDKIRAGETIQVIGNGRYRMQPIYVRDAAEIYTECLRLSDYDNQTFDLVGPKRMSYVDYIKLLGKVVQREPVIEYVAKPDALRMKSSFGMNEDDIDVLMCNEVGDEKLLQETFDIQLTPVERAVEKIVE